MISLRSYYLKSLTACWCSIRKKMLCGSLTRLGPISAPSCRGTDHCCISTACHMEAVEKSARVHTHINNIRSSTYSPGLFMADRGNSVGSRFDKQAFKFRWSLQNREPCMGGGCVGIRLLKSSFVHWYFLEAIEWTSVTSGDVLCLHARVRCRKIARSCLQGLKGWALN